MLPVTFLCIAALFFSSSAATFDDALQAFERGNYAASEQILNDLLEVHASDSAALGLLCAVLDAEQKYDEAGAAFTRALQLAPRSATIWNNYGNHQLATGNKAGARSSFLKAVAIDPKRDNANLQLGSLAVEEKNGTEAVKYLARLSESQRKTPQVQILSVQALFLCGRGSEAAEALANLKALSRNDARLAFTAGLALTQVSQFAGAEDLFSTALQLTGPNFDVLYNLGLAAYHARHLDRAHTAFESALSQRPNDVDALYNLAVVEVAQKQLDPALRLLVDAARIDPARASVQRMLAETASALGYYADALPAYENYLKLEPDDVAAQREKAFMIALAHDPRAGLAELRSFTTGHPKDVTAHYELGILETQTDPTDAKAQLNQALALQPDFQPARFGRGVVTLLAGDARAALPDLQASATKYPDNAQVLDRLGEAYLALGQANDAVITLRRASDLAPGNARILMHLSRGLVSAGQTEQARNVLAKFRAIGPKPGNLIPLPGYIEFLSLTKEQQYARYEEELKNRISADPTDPDLKVRYLGLLIGQGKAHEAASFANGIPADALPGPLAADAGHSLLQAEEYAAAMPFLERAASTLKTNESEIDLAIATMRTTGAQQSLVYLNGLSETARNGDYYLVKAEALEDLGKNEDAFTAIQQAVERAPARAELYKQAVLFLATNGESERATKLSAAAMRGDPNAPDILLLRAAMLANSHETETAEHLLKEIENRWPEWAPAYISYGAVLDSQRRTQEAQMQLATAVALGATSTDVYFFFPKSQFMRSR